MADVAVALVLNLHQAAYNLEDLLGRHEWEASEILWAMDRIPRSLWATATLAGGPSHRVELTRLPPPPGRGRGGGRCREGGRCR